MDGGRSALNVQTITDINKGRLKRWVRFRRPLFMLDSFWSFIA